MLLLHAILLIDALLLCAAAYYARRCLLDETHRSPSCSRSESTHDKQEHQRHTHKRDTHMKPPTKLALIVDVNNVRGAAGFARDVDEMVAALLRHVATLPPGAHAHLAVDHGPKTAAFLVDGRAIVSFAGKLDADDVIVCSAHYCAARGQRMRIHTSDALLRRRCQRAAMQATEKRGEWKALVNFEHRSNLCHVQPAAAVDDWRARALDDVLLGTARPTIRASEAVRARRRERAGIKVELTSMRETQANVLFARLEAAATARHARVEQLEPLDDPALRDDEPVAADDGVRARAFARAHGAWLNQTQELFALHRELRVDMAAFWERKLFGSSDDVR